MRKIYTGIDIGSDSIKVITLEYFNEQFNVLASSIVKSTGVRKGLITDANAVAISIKKAIKNVENKLGTKITQVVANVPSNNIEITMLAGHASVENEEITQTDISASLQDALKNNIREGNVVVSIFPVEYKVDKQKGIKNPLGMGGSDLSVKAIIASVPKKNVYSVLSAIKSLNIDVIDISFGSVGDYYAIKTKELDAKLVAIVNIGNEKTNISIFNKGIIIKEENIPLGGINIDNDISFTYKTDPEQSKKIKENFAVCNRKYADSDENYECINRLGEKVSINQYRLSEMIESRMVEMLKNIKNEINNLTKREIGYIIITGGITSMLGFNAIIEELFVRNANVINIGIIGIRDNKYSNAYGIIRYQVEKFESKNKEYTMFSEDKIEEMLSTGKKKGATSALGKIFGKIFD